jgi:hypothetical protein
MPSAILMVDDAGPGRTWLGPPQTLDATNTLFGGPSLSFDGSTRFWTTGSNLDEHQLQSGDFSVDGWLRFEGLGAGYSQGVVLGKAASFDQSYFVWVNSAGDFGFTYTTGGNSGSGVTTSAPGAVALHTWHHFEVTRRGTALHLFVDGVLKTTAVLSGTFYNSTVPLDIGRIAVSGFEYYWKGQLREIRVSKGSAGHTATFTPPAAPSTADAFTTVLLHGDQLVTPASTLAVGRPTKVVGSAPTSTLKRMMAPAMLRDLQYGGSGKVVGDVAIDDTPDVPVSRKVWLIRLRDAAVIRETWSNAATGAYAFLNVEMGQKYAVMTFDHNHVFNAVVADNLSPEPM